MKKYRQHLHIKNKIKRNALTHTHTTNKDVKEEIIQGLSVNFFFRIPQPMIFSLDVHV